MNARILAVPEGDIFLKRDTEILKNHFDIRTALTPVGGSFCDK